MVTPTPSEPAPDASQPEGAPAVSASAAAPAPAAPDPAPSAPAALPVEPPALQPPQPTARPEQAPAEPAASLESRDPVVYELAKPPDFKLAYKLTFGLIIPAALLVRNLLAEAPQTIDDSFISFRYARNLANGLGLVYNAGERIEGYTNFLWTVILAGFIKLGADPVVVSKILGSAAAMGTMVCVYLLAEKLKPYAWMPCLATWFLASTALFSAYSVLGLETSFFVFLLVAGYFVMSREVDTPEAFPWSAIPFSLAALTRPEAPMFVGLGMLCLGSRFKARQNLIRGTIFAAALGSLLLFRHFYYGAWVPNTFSAKTGNEQRQWDSGMDYVQGYLGAGGVLLWASVYGYALVALKRNWLGLAIGFVAVSAGLYPLAVGADWMPVHRYLAPLEPFLFLLVDLGVRTLAELGNRAGWVALLIMGTQTGVRRFQSFKTDEQILRDEKWRWDQHAGKAAQWFLDYGKPGTIALGDIGWVGYTTNYPILDLLGLVDPVIAKLPGGYTNKVGPEFLDYFYRRLPEYFVLLSSQFDCVHPFNPSTREPFNDSKGRFRANYTLIHQLHLWNENSWCIYGLKKNLPPDWVPTHNADPRNKTFLSPQK